MQTILWLISRCTKSTTQHSLGRYWKYLADFFTASNSINRILPRFFFPGLADIFFRSVQIHFPLYPHIFCRKSGFEGTNVGIVSSTNHQKPNAAKEQTLIQQQNTIQEDMIHLAPNISMPWRYSWSDFKNMISKEMVPHHPTNLHQERNLKCSTCEIWSTSDQLIFWVGNIHGPEIKLNEIPAGPAITRLPTKNY